MKIPKLGQFLIAVIAAYSAFKAPGWVMGKPIPESLIFMYMFFVIVTALLVMTSTDEAAEELVRPVRALVEDPDKAAVRNVVFAILPLVAGYLTYGFVSAGVEAPPALRSVHPAPPSNINAYGKTFDLAALENPFREPWALNEDPSDRGLGPERLKELANEGGIIYFKNCFFCHGDKLDGKGHYAHGLTPRPLPFQGKDTIAQLKESYVFWRIVKGGPGLPAEGGPGLSSMPAWEDKLTEEEVWKVILFLYDYTGNRPR
ncbi:MAG: cytochrome c [Deltaproteobacteria bacterium]|nr:cytochrome c [Deltaproteobacteria bacterium]